MEKRKSHKRYTLSVLSDKIGRREECQELRDFAEKARNKDEIHARIQEVINVLPKSSRLRTHLGKIKVRDNPEASYTERVVNPLEPPKRK